MTPPASWGEPRVALDPLAILLRSSYPSRAALARATGLRYEALRTWTDGLWRAQHPPPAEVLEALGRAVNPDELHFAVVASLATRPTQAITRGQRVMLEALRDFEDERLAAAAPYVYELLRDLGERDGEVAR